MHTSQEVANHLATLPNVRNVKPVRVTIGKKTWEGAAYEWLAKGAPGSPAEREGRETWRKRFYLISKKPEPKRKTCYTFQDGEWYIGGWANKATAINPQFAKYHTFGEWFDISQWKVPDGTKIDYFTDKPYQRVVMTVEYL